MCLHLSVCVCVCLRIQGVSEFLDTSYVRVCVYVCVCLYTLYCGRYVHFYTHQHTHTNHMYILHMNNSTYAVCVRYTSKVCYVHFKSVLGTPQKCARYTSIHTHMYAHTYAHVCSYEDMMVSYQDMIPVPVSYRYHILIGTGIRTSYQDMIPVSCPDRYPHT